MGLSTTNRILAAVLGVGILACSIQVAYGVGSSHAKAAWAKGVVLCVSRNGDVTAPGGARCPNGQKSLQLATSAQLVAAMDQADGAIAMPVASTGPAGAGPVVGPQGPRGETGATGATGASGPAGSSSGSGSGCSLATYPDLSGQDHHGCTVFSLNINGSDWVGANLAGAAWINSSAANVNLAHADLTGMRVTGTNLSGGDGSRLGGLDYANVTGVDFTAASQFGLGGVHMTGVQRANFPSTVPIATSVPGFGDVVFANGISVPGIDLHGRDITGTWLSVDDMSGGSLAGANLSNAILNVRDAHGLDLRGAQLTGATINNGIATFTGAHLEGLDLTHTTIWGKLSGAIMTGAVLPEVDHGLFGGYHEDLDLRSVVIPPGGANLQNFGLIRGSLAGVDFGASRWYAVGFYGADLSQVDLRDVWYDTPSVRGLFSANFNAADLSDANLAGTTLLGSHFNDSNLSRADLHGVTLTTSTNYCIDGVCTNQFIGTNLTQANLSGSDLRNGDFTNANFTGANLSNADLRGSTITGATFTGAIWTGATCPDGVAASGKVGGRCA